MRRDGAAVTVAGMGSDSPAARPPSSLDRDDLCALRAASDVSFHHLGGRGGLIRTRAASVFGEHRVEWERELVVRSAVTDHGAGPPAGCEYRASALILSSGVRWATIVAGLHAGDDLTLRWVANNNCDAHRHVGFVADELHLTAARHRSRRDRSWLVDYRVGPDNSARMVRHHWPHGRAWEPHVDTDRWFASITEGLARTRHRTVVVAVPAEVAAAFGAPYVGAVAERAADGRVLRFAADAARLADEWVALDAGRRRVVASGVVAPPRVTAGAGAQLYASLRAAGGYPEESARIALARSA